MSEEIRPLADDEFFHTPKLDHRISGNVVIKRPEGAIMTGEIGELGSISVGPTHVPGCGPAICFALHHPDGATLMATLGMGGYTDFAATLNDAVERIVAGEFDQPEKPQ